MATSNQIRYISHINLDKSKWDQCIDEAYNPLVYAKSFYLDIMSPYWDALVLADYTAVMPLTWKRKYGFYYLYQPFYVPSLGIFEKKNTGATVFDFLKAIPKKMRYWDIDMNPENLISGDNELSMNVYSRTNYLLDLNRSYADIASGYKRLCLRMIRKAAKQNIRIVRDVKPEDVIDFYRRHYAARQVEIPSGAYENLITATTVCYESGKAKTYLAELPSGEIVAAYLLLTDRKFVYSLIGGSSETGKETGSFYLLTDAAIKDHAGSETTFRFEGSDRNGIAFFNEQFGAEKIRYCHIRRNALPFPVNLIKKLFG